MGVPPPPPRAYTAISRNRISRKVLWVVLKKKFERMTREATDVCLRVLKESNKSRLDSYSVRNSVLIMSHITFWDCCVHIFSNNLSRNSCRTNQLHAGCNTLSLPPIFFFSCKIPGGKQDAFWEMCKSRIPISAQTYCQLRGMAWYGRASTLHMYTTKPPRQWQPWIAAVDIYLVPRRLSLEENVRAKEGGKETAGETALRLPSVPFPWSLAVHHQSLTFRLRLYGAKNEAPEEEAELVLFRKDPRNPGEYQQNFMRGGSRPPRGPTP